MQRIWGMKYRTYVRTYRGMVFIRSYAFASPYQEWHVTQNEIKPSTAATIEHTSRIEILCSKLLDTDRYKRKTGDDKPQNMWYDKHKRGDGVHKHDT